jgi:hypothetical protein
MPFFGHTATHSPQPLHRSISITILPAIMHSLPPFGYCLRPTEKPRT